ncbi:hypothetical protein O4J56_01400 [Nocardiopsis sp. RSe5-2]|uniref:DUF3558 domain-containing protein n=1 Tax=Nocardiopsis endophytica TaxID=3018445 RepID=A0ABT4TX64_9ACTN|nr:hypothetical protein [Nocardiopsis endophytica]MDA2809280.1 hypothetical protein [Nocardiopsis endophytica]
MYTGPPNVPQAPPQPPPPRRGRTGRTVAITAAVTLGAYAVVAGTTGAVLALGGPSAPEGASPRNEDLPEPPCGVPTRAQLDEVGAQLPNASVDENSSDCSWYSEFSDGTLGWLRVSYGLPTDDDGELDRGTRAAEEDFASKSEDLLEESDDEYWTSEVIDSHEPDLGDEALVVHYRWGDSDDLKASSEVLVRVDEVLVRVTANEAGDARGGSGEAGFSEDEETLVAVAERAVAALE